MRRSSRGAFTALEVMIAVVLMSVILTGAIALFGTSSKGLTTTAAHAEIRSEAMRVMEVFGRDIDRLVVGDDFDTGRFPSVVDPIELEHGPDGTRLTFYAYHHRRFHREERRMELVGQRVRYEVRSRRPGIGVDLLRNEVAVNRMPLHSVEIRTLDPTEAGTLGVSPLHALELTLRPLTPGRGDDERLARNHAQARVFHMRNVESQYACLLSLKRAGAPYPILAMVPNPPRQAAIHGRYQLDQVPLDWLRPLGLVAIERHVDFDDATEHVHEEVD